MITLKIPIQLNKENKIFLTDLRRLQSSIIRYSFNRFQENKSIKEVEHDCKSKFKIDSWYMRCAIMEGNQLFIRFENKKILFGGKTNFYNKIKNKITKEEYETAIS